MVSGATYDVTGGASANNMVKAPVMLRSEPQERGLLPPTVTL